MPAALRDPFDGGKASGKDEEYVGVVEEAGRGEDEGAVGIKKRREKGAAP